MRLGEAAGDEERLVMLLVQLRDGVVHELEVRHVLIAAVQRRDGQLAGADRAPGRAVLLAGRSAPWPPQPVVPFLRAVHAGVIDLAGSADMIAGFAKLGGERDLRRDDRLERLLIVVNAGGPGAQAGHERSSRGVADGRGAVASGEPDPAPGQPVHVGREGLFVAAQVADPVVQVVHGDEQHVGLARRGVGGRPAGSSQGQPGQEGDDSRETCSSIVHKVPGSWFRGPARVRDGAD